VFQSLVSLPSAESAGLRWKNSTSHSPRCRKAWTDSRKMFYLTSYGKEFTIFLKLFKKPFSGIGNGIHPLQNSWMKHEGVLYERPESDGHRLLLKAGGLFLTELSDLKASLFENTWMPIGMGQKATNEVFMEGREELRTEGERVGSKTTGTLEYKIYEKARPHPGRWYRKFKIK